MLNAAWVRATLGALVIFTALGSPNLRGSSPPLNGEGSDAVTGATFTASLNENSAGARLFEQRCSGCHNGSAPKAPEMTMLSLMPTMAIYTTITTGIMREQASGLNTDERRGIAEFLTKRPLNFTAPPPIAPPCANKTVEEPPAWSGWGINQRNTRMIPSDLAGLDKTSVADLRRSYAYALPGATRVRSQPALLGDSAIFGTQDGHVYAVDLNKRCLRWTFSAKAEVRTGIVLNADKNASGHETAFFGDLIGNIYAISVRTGALRWTVHPETHSNATITGSPILSGNTLYVPISSLEPIAAASPDYACCTFRGSLVALDQSNGKLLWQTFTVDKAPVRQGDNARGVAWYGPSGAPIWGAPAIDEGHKQIIVGTGENYSSPSDGSSDAIIAMDLATGRKRWTYQALAKDAFNASCISSDLTNCPHENGQDLDFGAAPIVGREAFGQTLIFAGQKSGWVYALDAADGKLVWKQRVGRGGLIGGIHFSIALSGKTLIVPMSDSPDGRPHDRPASPGISVLDASSGKILWQVSDVGQCAGRKQCSPGIPGTITVTPDLIFAGGGDGIIRAYELTTGKVLWEADTTMVSLSPSQLNAQGGTIGGGVGPLPYRGRLIVGSGYGFANKMPGNAIIIYDVRR